MRSLPLGPASLWAVVTDCRPLNTMCRLIHGQQSVRPRTRPFGYGRDRVYRGLGVARAYRCTGGTRTSGPASGSGRRAAHASFAWLIGGCGSAGHLGVVFLSREGNGLATTAQAAKGSDEDRGRRCESLGDRGEKAPVPVRLADRFADYQAAAAAISAAPASEAGVKSEFSLSCCFSPDARLNERFVPRSVRCWSLGPTSRGE